MRGRFHLSLELRNDAMSELDDVADALEAVAGALRAGHRPEGNVRDANGNTVGRWGLEEEPAGRLVGLEVADWTGIAAQNERVDEETGARVVEPIDGFAGTRRREVRLIFDSEVAAQAAMDALRPACAERDRLERYHVALDEGRRPTSLATVRYPRSESGGHWSISLEQALPGMDAGPLRAVAWEPERR